MIEALIFDFDGLILETEGPIYASWQEVYQSYGLHLPVKTWATIIGTHEGVFDPYDDLEKQLSRPLERKEIERQRRQREHELVSQQPVMPGVVDYLKTAKRMGLKLGVASSSTRPWVAGHLARLGLLEQFDSIVTRENVAKAKPEPDLFLLALEKLGVRPNTALVLEDSYNGLLAARKAGIRCVAVPHDLTRHMPMHEADLCISSLEDVPLEVLLQQIDALG